MKTSVFLLIILCSFITYGQSPERGNVIPEFGKTFEVQNPEFATDTTSLLKVVFDVNRSFNAEEPNKLIETAARFLNMHEKAGVVPSNMRVALVIHGKAVKDVLAHTFYREEFPSSSKNPNISLIEALVENGVELVLCGQSAAHYKVSREKAHPQVKFALSAMTALVQLQNENYRLIAF
ncbi:DsrE family protein [Christiangramia aquimixticola]|uniref:DsrE family protein n=1 Tax=Christiangramia aquimixticola TaxID=1697558 RepID=UPI003AA90E42